MNIEIAIDRIGAWRLPSGLYRYKAEETGFCYDVTRLELLELQILMNDPDPSVRRDAYSLWCAGGAGRQVPDVRSELRDVWGEWLADIYLDNCDMLESLEDSSIEEIEAQIELTLKTTKKLNIRDAFEDLLQNRPKDLIKAVIELVESERDPIYAIDPDEGDFLVDNS